VALKARVSHQVWCVQVGEVLSVAVIEAGRSEALDAVVIHGLHQLAHISCAAGELGGLKRPGGHHGEPFGEERAQAGHFRELGGAALGGTDQRRLLIGVGGDGTADVGYAEMDVTYFVAVCQRGGHARRCVGSVVLHEAQQVEEGPLPEDVEQ